MVIKEIEFYMNAPSVYMRPNITWQCYKKFYFRSYMCCSKLNQIITIYLCMIQNVYKGKLIAFT